jgi:diguanylate cyclase (GGDEF)-like protein/PAS domain S-box-containing protein
MDKISKIALNIFTRIGCMIKKIIELKEYSSFLRINRNDIIDKWVLSEVVETMFVKHSMKMSETNKKIFYDFLDCFISVMQWKLTISECPAKMKFLKILHENNFSSFELFELIIALKNVISDIFYENKFLSFGLLNDLEKVSIISAKDLSDMYEQIRKDEINFKDEHSNLLNEYKKAVDLSNIVSKSNHKGIITYANEKFCEISGYSKSELIGQPHSIVRHPIMPSRVFKELWDTIKSKKAWHGVVTNMRKDGKKYVVDSTIIPILDMDGDIVEFIAIRHDVTEFEETKDQLSTLNMAMKNRIDELYNMTTSLEEEASIDSLTGAFNRTKFEKFFDYEVEKAQLSKNVLSVIILDIDHFKSINDNYGHHVGDDVLKDLVKLITKNLKRIDIFARWGGEEFVILLPGTELKNAKILAENIRSKVEEASFSTAGKITVSFGVGEHHDTESKKDIFNRVDKLLYEAKKAGRNRVMA